MTERDITGEQKVLKTAFRQEATHWWVAIGSWL